MLVATIDWFGLIFNLLGGLCVFLFGMSMLSENLRGAFKERLKDAIRVCCSNPILGFVTGIVSTALLASSSASSVLVVSFVDSGEMTFQQSVGVMLGVNVGATVVSLLVAFKVTRYGLFLFTMGYGGQKVIQSERGKLLAAAVQGLGLLFVGMETMTGAVASLKTYPPFLDFLQNISHPMLGAMVGNLATVCLNSASAVVGVAMALAHQGLMDLRLGVAIVLGANIGTCATAIFAAIGKTRRSLRVATVYLLTKIIGVMVAMPLLDYLCALTKLTSKYVDTQVAHSHLLFNVILSLAMLPFTSLLAHITTLIIPHSDISNLDIKGE